MKKKYILNSHEEQIDVTSSAPGELQGIYNHQYFKLNIISLETNMARIQFMDKYLEVSFVKSPEGLFLRMPSGRSYHVTQSVYKRSKNHSKNHQDAFINAKIIKSPMPGKVLKIMAKKGQKVTRGEPVMILEAMKMEHTLKAPLDGEIENILAKVGDTVKGQQELVTFKIAAKEVAKNEKN